MRTRGRPKHPDILTPRQWDVLALLRRGLTNEEIARELHISADGVKYHVSDILSRLDVESRHEAAAWQPQAERSRWAMLLAPALLVKKLKLGAVGYAVAAAAVGATAIGVALLVWGIVSTSRDRDRASVASTPSVVARTGIPQIDRAIDLLVHQDVDGLVKLAEYGPIGCSVTQTVGSPPPCAPGEPEGAPVNVFPMGQCEGSYATNDGQLKGAFGLALQRQPSVAVYAVLRDNSQDRTRDNYWIAITQDRPSQATANVSLWNVTAGGHVVALQNECGPIGAAQQVAYRFPVNPDFVLGPFNNCPPPPGEIVNFMITVDGLSPGGIKPQFWGEAQSTIGSDTGERAIVTVAPATAWYGGQKALDQVRSGMVLEAVGPRQPDCTILAETILSESTGTPVTGPPKAGTISGQIIQDVDGNKDFSLDDLPAKTLVQLVAPQRTLDLYTDADGTYRFDNIPDGQYTLRIWWKPGFADVLSVPSDAGRYDVVVTVDVSRDVPVNASGPLRVWVTPVVDGTLPFPATEAHEPVPTGALDAGAALVR